MELVGVEQDVRVKERGLPFVRGMSLMGKTKSQKIGYLPISGIHLPYPGSSAFQEGQLGTQHL